MARELKPQSGPCRANDTRPIAIRNPQSGQALVPVLFVTLILTAMAVALTQTAKRETRAAGAQIRDIQQYNLAQSAVKYAMAELQQATGGGATPPQLNPPPDTDANGWTQLGDGWFKIDIIDTSSRLNINIATEATLAKLPSFANNPDIAPSIIDWRDTDDNPTTAAGGGTGAESDYYQALQTPYSAKNAPFDSIDELLLVKGITPQILYGAPNGNTNPNPMSGSGLVTGVISRQAGGQNTGNAVDMSSSTTPLSELVTTYSKELNVAAADGSKRVNMKTASQQEIQQLGVSANVARNVAQNRGQNGANLTSIADLFTMGFTRQVMQQVGDKITLTDNQYRNGLVNINTAPPEVIATIPGVDQNVYNAIIQARQNGTVFTGLNDVFSIQGLQATQLRSFIDKVCTKSSVYLIRVRTRMPGSPRVYAAEALVELAPPQQQATTGTGATTGAAGAAGATAQQQSTDPKILMWREVPKSPGWSTWAPGPNYYTTTTTSSPTLSRRSTGG